MSYDGYGEGDDHGLAVALKERLRQAGPALAPAPDVVSGAQRRYRRQRLASMAAGAGALACLAGGGVAAVQWLSPGQTVVTSAADGSGATGSDGTAAAGATGGAATPTVLEVGGLPFALPPGFEPIGSVDITDLTPSAQDPMLPGGVSLVAQAEPSGGQAVGGLTIALYKGPVAEDLNGQDDPSAFGTTPSVEHVTLAGHDARMVVRAECGDWCSNPRPIERGGSVPAECDTAAHCVLTAVGKDQVVVGPAAFPHVDLHVALGPDAYLVVSTAGLGRDEVVAMVTAALEADSVTSPPAD